MVLVFGARNRSTGRGSFPPAAQCKAFCAVYSLPPRGLSLLFIFWGAGPLTSAVPPPCPCLTPGTSSFWRRRSGALYL
eukprot:1185647-Prorocentrum_minimum.AAC.6